MGRRIVRKPVESRPTTDEADRPSPKLPTYSRGIRQFRRPGLSSHHSGRRGLGVVARTGGSRGPPNDSRVTGCSVHGDGLRTRQALERSSRCRGARRRWEGRTSSDETDSLGVRGASRRDGSGRRPWEPAGRGGSSHPGRLDIIPFLTTLIGIPANVPEPQSTENGNLSKRVRTREFKRLSPDEVERVEELTAGASLHDPEDEQSPDHP